MSKKQISCADENSLLREYLSRLIQKAPEGLFPEGMSIDEIESYFFLIWAIHENVSDKSTRASDLKKITKAIKAIDALIQYFDHSTKEMSSVAFNTLIELEKDWLVRESDQNRKVDRENLSKPVLNEYNRFVSSLQLKKQTLEALQQWLKANKNYTNIQYRNDMLTELANKLINSYNYPIERARLRSAEIFSYFGVDIPTLNARWQEYGEEKTEDQRRILRDMMKNIKSTPKTQKR